MIFAIFGFIFVPALLLALAWLLKDMNSCRNTQYMAVKDPSRYTYSIQCNLSALDSITGFELIESGKCIAKYSEKERHSPSGGGKCGLPFRDSFVTFQTKWDFYEVCLLDKDESIGIFRQFGFNHSKKELRFKSQNYSLAPVSESSPDLEIRQGESEIALITYHPSSGQNRSRRIYFVNRQEIWLEAMICLVGVFSFPRFGHFNKVEHGIA